MAFGERLEQLILEKNKFYRIKRGQSAAEVEKVFLCPAKPAFNGAIITVEECTVHIVQPFETYSSIAGIYGVEAEELKLFNSSHVLYPSCKIYVPTR